MSLSLISLPKPIDNVSSFYISTLEVSKDLSSMGLDSTYGPDTLIPIILSQCCYALTRPVYII
jgi:hypothetical protein